MEPTVEQAEAIRLFKTGDSLAIEAGAGTGKTSTLVLIAQAASHLRGQYVAFNRDLVADSKAKFPANVMCNTAHSLAFREVGKNYKARLDRAERMPGRVIASRLGWDVIMDGTAFDGKPKSIYPGFVASLAAKTVTRFCQSADVELEPRHVPFQDGLSVETVAELRAITTPLACKMWEDLQTPHGWVPFKHEHYLKMWQLQEPYIQADFILFDEAQDANPVIAAIVASQDHWGTQLVYVGDSQQEIYAWTGAVNALARVQVKNRSFLTQSFRFGQAIADRANVELEKLGSPLRLTGNPSIASRVEQIEEPRAILVRTNATGLSLMLRMQDEEKRVHFLGATDALLGFTRAADELQRTGRTAHPDLVHFDSWAAVREYVAQDEGGEDLRLNVKLIDEFGPEKIIMGIMRMPMEREADIVISTAHKSKGRQWPSVQLAADFPTAAMSDMADLRLLYVAITRAQEVLDDTALVVPHDDREVSEASELNVGGIVH